MKILEFNICSIGFHRVLIMLMLYSITSPVLAEWYRDNADIMGTRISVSFWLDDSPTMAIESEQLLSKVFDEMRRIDERFSPYKASSELAQVNRLAPVSVQAISAELARLIDKSLYFSRLSDGAFDISFASVGHRYDYRNAVQPGSQQVQALLPAINYQMIILDDKALSLSFGHPQLRIDLGGVAKGYAVDRAVELLKNEGVVHASVSAGGDSRLLGDMRGRPWLVGIKNPRGDGDVAITLPLYNVAVSTSGDYERYFIDSASGERVHHIINPSTGRAAGELASVTVLGPQGFDADPLSTTVFVLGVRKGLALLNRLSGYDGILIDRSGRVHYSDGLAPPSKS